MTQNQIAYQANLERERANRAMEALKESHFRRSNWHQAIKNIGASAPLSSIASGIVKLLL